jgi:hypothetical protein
MARVRLVVHKTWLVQNPPPDLDAAIDRAIQAYGMTATRVGDRLELVGGSSFKVKALGAKLTADVDLPRVGTVERGVGSEDPGTERITVHLEDRLNSAYIDPPIARKYDRVFGGFASRIEAALSGASADGGPGPVRDPDVPADSAGIPGRPGEPVVRAAGWWTDVALGTIVKRCHVAGAPRQDVGALHATEAGIAFTGNPKGGCRWEDVAGFEVIELRQGGDAGRVLGRCIRLSSRNGDVGEFWIKGRAAPTAAYAIEKLVPGAR